MVNKTKTIISSFIVLIIFTLIVVFVLASQKDNTDSNNTEYIQPSIRNSDIGSNDLLRNAEITLDSTVSVINLNSENYFDIIIDTKGFKIVGTDVIINYDSNIVEILRLEESGEFDMYLGNNFNNKEIMFSGLFNIGTQKSGVFNLGRVYYRAIDTGKAKFSVQYKYMDTTDSNIVEHKNSQDVLGKVNNIEITIK